MSSQRRKAFTIEEKGAIICRLENGESNSSLAKEFGVGHSTISMIFKNKGRIKQSFNSNVLKPKRLRKSRQKNVEEALIQWFKNTRNKGIPVSGPKLQEKANIFATRFGIFNFNCSASWISRFKVRHNIVAGKVVGESSSLDQNITTNWLTSVWPNLRRQFSDDEIFADETGLFYKLMPDKTLKFRDPTQTALEERTDASYSNSIVVGTGPESVSNDSDLFLSSCHGPLGKEPHSDLHEVKIEPNTEEQLLTYDSAGLDDHSQPLEETIDNSQKHPLEEHMESRTNVLLKNKGPALSHNGRKGKTSFITSFTELSKAKLELVTLQKVVLENEYKHKQKLQEIQLQEIIEENKFKHLMRKKELELIQIKINNARNNIEP